jgi:hypothetical protein
MIRISRAWLTVIVLTFGLFLTAQGALRTHNFHDSGLAMSASVVYFVCLAITALAFKSSRLHTWAAWLNIVAAVYIPLTLHQTHIGEMLGDSDTWYVTALALLFGSMAVRQQMQLAILGTLILMAEVLLFGGVDFVSRSGLTGAVLLVVAAIAISIGLDRSDKSIIEIQNLSAAEKRESLITETAREQHRIRVDEAMQKVLPALQDIASGKKFSKSDKLAASKLAQLLEDEITGGRLVTAEIKRASSAARDRGIEVTLIDELDIIEGDEAEFQHLLDIAASTIDSVQVGRIKLVATKDADFLLRLTATRPGVVTPDLDLKLGERQF